MIWILKNRINKNEKKKNSKITQSSDGFSQEI